MTDPAAFDKSALEAIHGTYPESWTRPGVVADDAHHLLMRGFEFGAGPRHPLRYIFSSPYNACMIDRASHDAMALREYDLRCFFLNLAIDAVTKAVTDGRYELQEKDHLFLAFSRKWRLNPRQPKLLTNLL